MCGIFAIFSKKDYGFSSPSDFDKLVENLATFTQVRGTDSFGFFYTNRDNPKGKPGYYKNPTAASLALEDTTCRKFLGNIFKDGQCIIGHCRSATMGEISVENTHPFLEGDITLIHNGTLRSGWIKYQKDKSWSDSHCLTQAMSEKGTECFSEIQGAYSIVWHDQRDGCIHIARNYERPLFIWENPAYVILGSEVVIMSAAIIRAGIKYESGKLWELPVCEDWKWDLDKYTWTKEGDIPAFHWVPPINQQTKVIPIPTATGKVKEVGGNATNRYARGTEVMFEIVNVSVSSNGHLKYGAITLEEIPATVTFYRSPNNALDPELTFFSGTVRRYSAHDDHYSVEGRTVEPIEASSYEDVWDIPVLTDVIETGGIALTLLDGRQMPAEDFIKAADKRCVNCNSKILLEEYPNCVYSTTHDGVFCPECAPVFYNPLNSVH